VPDRLAGKKVRCPKCKATFTAGAEEGNGVVEAPEEAPARRAADKVADRPRRRVEEDEDEVEEVRPRRRSARDEEDEEEEDRPRRRRARDEDEDEDEEDDRPRSKRKRRRDEDEDEDEEEERPLSPAQQRAQFEKTRLALQLCIIGGGISAASMLLLLLLHVLALSLDKGIDNYVFLVAGIPGLLGTAGVAAGLGVGLAGSRKPGPLSLAIAGLGLTLLVLVFMLLNVLPKSVGFGYKMPSDFTYMASTLGKIGINLISRYVDGMALFQGLMEMALLVVASLWLWQVASVYKRKVIWGFIAAGAAPAVVLITLLVAVIFDKALSDPTSIEGVRTRVLVLLLITDFLVMAGLAVFPAAAFFTKQALGGAPPKPKKAKPRR
jgi:hypothetical protein